MSMGLNANNALMVRFNQTQERVPDTLNSDFVLIHHEC